ncbi:MAG TPA: hypothetical protein VI548_14795 [Chitinophagaceae bacterium]|nr:hypothetical protein [Chitinophagaceae bacterium]
MKKFYFLLAVALFAATLSVSAQRVILRLNNNYEVNIDGRYYGSNATVPTLSYGQHTVKLYEVQPGILGIGKRRNLVSSSTFEMRDNDVLIETDQNGQLRINQVGNYNNSQTRNRDRNNNENGDYGYQKNTQQRNGKGYGPYNNPGRGHKYGLYKKGRENEYRKDHEKDHVKGNKKNKKTGNKNHDRENDD